MTDIHAAVPWPELYQNGELIIIILIPSWSTIIFKKQAQEIQPVLNLHKYYVHFSLLRIWTKLRTENGWEQSFN